MLKIDSREEGGYPAIHAKTWQHHTKKLIRKFQLIFRREYMWWCTNQCCRGIQMGYPTPNATMINPATIHNLQNDNPTKQNETRSIRSISEWAWICMPLESTYIVGRVCDIQMAPSSSGGGREWERKCAVEQAQVACSLNKPGTVNISSNNSDAEHGPKYAILCYVKKIVSLPLVWPPPPRLSVRT